MTATRKLAIFRLRHDEFRYFDIEASGGWDRVCLTMFRYNDRLGYYLAPLPVPPMPLPPSGYDDLESLENYANAVRQYRRAVNKSKNENEYWELVLLARQGDLAAARLIIESRKNNCWYEDYFLDELEIVTDEDLSGEKP